MHQSLHGLFKSFNFIEYMYFVTLISANDELRDVFASSKDGSVRVIKVAIENGMLYLTN